MTKSVRSKRDPSKARTTSENRYPSKPPTESEPLPWSSPEIARQIAVEVAKLGWRTQFAYDGTKEYAPTNDPQALLDVARVLRAVSLALITKDREALAALGAQARACLLQPHARRLRLDERGEPIDYRQRERPRTTFCGGDIVEERVDAALDLRTLVMGCLGDRRSSSEIAKYIAALAMGDSSRLQEELLRSGLDLNAPSAQAKMTFAIEKARSRNQVGESVERTAQRVVKNALHEAGYLRSASLFDAPDKKSRS